MKTLAFAALTLSLLASTAEAWPFHRATAHAAGAPTAVKAAAAIGRDGQDARQRCSNENPNIEYRDCVNASTRDPNAKIRLG